MFINILLILFFTILFAILITFALGGISAAPWVPLWRSDIRRMLKLADLKEGEKLIDLGSGDGRILKIAAKEFNASALGYEIAVLPYIISLVIINITNLKNKYKIKVKYKSFFSADLSGADVITVFLTPMAMKKLQKKFVSGLKPGCRIVSYAFSMPDWKPTKISKPNEKKTTVYLYTAK